MNRQNQSSYSLRNERPKRNRCPSQYTSHINKLKQETKKNNKQNKDQTSISQDLEEPKIDKKAIVGGKSKAPLICKLPNGRKIQLSIVLAKNKIKPPKAPTPTNLKPKEQATKSLLDLFQNALFNVQNASEQNPKFDTQSIKHNQDAISLSKKRQIINQSEKSKSAQKRQPKKDKISDQQKMNKIYEKFKSLNQKLEQYKQNMTLL